MRLFALWITGTPLNVSSFMGVILLIGLDVKNGIILIEYIGQLRALGMPLEEALLKAGRTRFRPILMTSLCTILGLVPLAMGWGPGAQMQQPLAIAVIGGLITNMLLTRLLIPVGYLAIEKLRGSIGIRCLIRRIGQRELETTTSCEHRWGGKAQHASHVGWIP